MAKVTDIDTDREKAKQLVADWQAIQDKLNNRPSTTPEIIDDVYFILDRLANGLKYVYIQSE
jgi:hypothetical protein